MTGGGPRAATARYIDRRFPGARVLPLAGDASTRRFFRIHPALGTSVVLMDYGQPFVGETDDMRLGRIFRRAGLPVADLLVACPDPGCLVLEDLGDRSLESELAGCGDDSEPPVLLVRAVELAAEVACRGTPALEAAQSSPGPALDAERFRFEMDFFLEHYVSGLLGRGRTSPGLREALHQLADRAAGTPAPVLCHRDYHSRNLLVRGEDDLFMVDIQDARWGPDTYDLASILRDAYAPVADRWLDPLLERYRECLDSPPEAESFRVRLHTVAAQRMIKALGSFGFLSGVDRARDYLGAVPPTLARLDRALPARPETRELHERLATEGLLTPPAL